MSNWFQVFGIFSSILPALFLHVQENRPRLTLEFQFSKRYWNLITKPSIKNFHRIQNSIMVLCRWQSCYSFDQVAVICWCRSNSCFWTALIFLNPGWPDMQTIKCFHIWKLVAIQKNILCSCYGKCFPYMIIVWIAWFHITVWPFYWNHVFKYGPFMETMFSSMTLSSKPCFQVWSFYGYHVF